MIASPGCWSVGSGLLAWSRLDRAPVIHVRILPTFRGNVMRVLLSPRLQPIKAERNCTGSAAGVWRGRALRAWADPVSRPFGWISTKPW